MGFSSVYKVLQEVFPQVDSRILRAVAIENSKDADVAVEVVLVEVIPNLSKQQLADSSPNKGKSPLIPFEVGSKTGQLESAMDPVNVSPHFLEQSTEAGSSSINGSLPAVTEAVDAGSSGQPNCVEAVILGSPDKSFYHDANDETEAFYDGEKSSINPDSASPVLIYENGSYDNHDQECEKTGGLNVDSYVESLVSETGFSGSTEEEATSQMDVTASAAEDSFIHLNVDTESLIAPSSETHLAVTQESDPSSSSSKTTSEKNSFGMEIVNSEDESIMTSMLTRSEEKCSTELLEEIIEDARDNRKTLLLAMNSVVDLMREVEFKEKAVDQAKEEATRDCSGIFVKVDELKQTLLRAKEANDMHAGEVYAEKAILATEFKELQLRLFTLSDERNKSLAILDQMRTALEIRLATALEEIAAAEEEKVKNQKSARDALSYQESEMEKVVEESKKLKLEAEENSKLQEFLMDRGRAIDILQGEFSVTCQDVLLLKEKFDKRIPLSRSLSSSQTSSILASSGSSFRSTVTPLEPEPEPESYESPKKGPGSDDSYGFLDKSLKSELAQSPKSPIETVHHTDDYYLYGEEKHIDDRKKLIDDGWDIFDA